MILGFIRRYPCWHFMERSHGSFFLCLARATTGIIINNPYLVLEWARRECGFLLIRRTQIFLLFLLILSCWGILVKLMSTLPHTHREFMNYTLLFRRVNSIFSCNKFDLNVIFDLKTPHMPSYCRQLQTYWHILWNRSSVKHFWTLSWSFSISIY